jgi:phosphoribosyl 1,2-cyclic phosphate phosphodiesterase
VTAGVADLDAVLYTHAHADHVHGIDDLRALSTRQGAQLPAYGPAATLADLATRFAYVFDRTLEPRPGTSRPELLACPLESGRAVAIGGMVVLPVELPHGDQSVFGYRVGPIAYLTDVKAIPDAAAALLAGVEVLVLNALYDRPHPLHLSISEAVAAAERIGAPRTFLTHLTHQTPHAELADRLPPGVAPAYDGLVVEVAAS